MSVARHLVDAAADPVYLIDGSALVFRGFYGNGELCRSDGFPTGAIFLVARILLRLLREERPRRMVMILDGKGPTFRHELFPPYKSQRNAPPEGLIAQLDPVRRLTTAMGIPLVVSDGCEADDCIASLAAREGGHGAAVILSADKDLKQCLRPNVIMWDPVGRTGKVVTAASFTAETGLTPQQWPDVQAIIGDTADNIPGVPGIGIKGAEKLFKLFRSLEDIRDRFDEVPPPFRKKLADHLDAMFLYRRLTAMRTTDCADMTDDDLLVRPPDAAELVGILREFELGSLFREAHAVFGDVPASDGPSTRRVQGSLLVPGDPPPADRTGRPAVRVVTGLPDLRRRAGRDIALIPCPEGFRLASGGDEIVCACPARPLAELLAGTVATSPATRIVVPDLKGLTRSDPAWKAVPASRYFDLSIAAYLLDPERQDVSWPGLRGHWSALLGIDPASEGILALTMAETLGPQLDAAGLTRLMRGVELPLAPVLADMEARGILLDTAGLAGFLAHVREELDGLTARIHEAAGGPFNIRSARQLGDVLFKRLALPVSGRTGGGQASTDKDTLERLSGTHPVVDALLRYRILDKLRSTYLEPLPGLVGSDGRIRTTLNQCATATGRLSSSDPNLQNIPVRGEDGRRMRACFTVPAGKSMVSADYSQIELRVLAHMSGDPELTDAFRRGEDVHARTAGLLYGVPASDVTKEQRAAAKTVNFGLLYGMGAAKLAGDLGIPQTEAKAFRDRYFEKLTRLKDFYEEVESDARRDLFVTTIAGRRRPLPGFRSPSRRVVALAERQAVNTVIQGSAADLIKMAMLAVARDPLLKELGAEMLLQIHDELLLEVPENHAEQAGARVAELMENVMPLSVPLVAEWGTGRNWGDAH